MDQVATNLTDAIFNIIFLNQNVWFSIETSLKFLPNGSIGNKPVLAQVMAWRRSGDKPLSEPMMVRLPTDICVTRSQWVIKHLGSQSISGNVTYVYVQCLYWRLYQHLTHLYSIMPYSAKVCSCHCIRVWIPNGRNFQPKFIYDGKSMTVYHASTDIVPWGTCLINGSIPRTKASDAELWCFLWSAPE